MRTFQKEQPVAFWILATVFSILVIAMLVGVLNPTTTDINAAVQREVTRQVSELVAPTTVPELAQLKSANLTLTIDFQQAVQRLQAVANSPNAKRPTEIEQSLLAKFTIPDSEVNYRRPK
ncbi:MAG: hypothetical protein EXR67_03565 [Dehalococcoidia bacterium]|nr:hypothetical protein [Dehalococcoidia bacterium]